MRKIALLAFVAVLFSFGSTFAQSSNTDTEVAKEVEVKKNSPFDGIVEFKTTTADFGTTKLHKAVAVEYQFKNVGKKPLILKSVQPSCGCTTPDWTKEPILPGKTGMIKATYDASGLGQVNKTVFVNFHGIAPTMELQIVGKVEK